MPDKGMIHYSSSGGSFLLLLAGARSLCDLKFGVERREKGSDNTRTMTDYDSFVVNTNVGG